MLQWLKMNPSLLEVVVVSPLEGKHLPILSITHTYPVAILNNLRFMFYLDNVLFVSLFFS